MVVGLFHTDTVEKVLLLHTVVVVTVDKVELVAAALSKLHTSNGKKWQIIHPIKKLLTIGSLTELFHHQRLHLDLFLTGV